MADRLIVLYDAECSLCQAARQRLEALDTAGRLQLTPMQEAWVRETLPHIQPWQMKQRMHVVRPDGQVFSGAAAVREIGKVVVPTRPMAVWLKLYSWGVQLPGMLPIAERVYDMVAANRYRFNLPQACGCETGTCAIHEPPR